MNTNTPLYQSEYFNPGLDHSYHQTQMMFSFFMGQFTQFQKKIDALEGMMGQFAQTLEKVNYLEARITELSNISYLSTQGKTPFTSSEKDVLKEEATNSTFESSSNVITKVEDDASIDVYLPPSEQPGNLSSEDDDEDEFRTTKRKNGFKSHKKSANRKNTEKDSPKATRPRAKHVWVTYGRKIVEFALNKVKDEQVRNWIGESVKILISKKGYSEVFIIKNTDTAKIKEYKKVLAKWSLKFFEDELSNSFLNSNYRDELLGQASRIKERIVYLAKCEN